MLKVSSDSPFSTSTSLLINTNHLFKQRLVDIGYLTLMMVGYKRDKNTVMDVNIYIIMI